MGGERQFKAVAKYSDGSIRDVTELALYESNRRPWPRSARKVSVRVQRSPGQVAVMVRFQGKVAVFTAAVPLGAPVEDLPEPMNFVDEHVFANLKQIGIPPSPVCDDATFLRRVTLDIAGRLPSEAEAREFLAETDSRQTRSSDRSVAPQSRLRRLLREQMDAAAEESPRRRQRHHVELCLPCLGPRQLAGERALRSDRSRTAGGDRNRDRQSAGRLVQAGQRTESSKSKTSRSCSWACGCSVPSATTIRSSAGAKTTTTLAAFFSQVGRKPTGIRGEDLIFHERGIAEGDKHARPVRRSRRPLWAMHVGEIAAG